MSETARLFTVGITGPRGFIGSHLARQLALDPTSRVLTCPRESFASVTTLREFVGQCNTIVHLAAMTRGDDNLIYDTNMNLVDRLIEAMADRPAPPHVIFASSTQRDREHRVRTLEEGGRNALARMGEADRRAAHDPGYSGCVRPRLPAVLQLGRCHVLPSAGARSGAGRDRRPTTFTCVDQRSCRSDWPDHPRPPARHSGSARGRFGRAHGVTAAHQAAGDARQLLRTEHRSQSVGPIRCESCTRRLCRTSTWTTIATGRNCTTTPAANCSRLCGWPAVDRFFSRRPSPASFAATIFIVAKWNGSASSAAKP